MKVYNTLKRKKEKFNPLEEDRVKMYVCGPTVYDHPHMGHARTYISYDIIRRYLESKGYDVLYVQNITDVGHLTEDTEEDKIIKKAKERKVQPMEIADFFTKEFLESMDALNVKRPNIMPRATGHLIDMIEAIKTLIKKGYGYERNGTVYYDVHKFEDYGKLSNKNLEELEAGARVGVKEEKKHPADFALWVKASPEHLMKWPSPWSEGYPGWHIECSVMSRKYIGDTLDIHGGAIELSFPHHENEIAQSEAITGKKFAKYWIHTGLLNIGGEKMSKSKGNFITIKEALKKHDPEVIRLWVASSSYRKPINYSEDDLNKAKESLERLYTTLYNTKLLKESEEDIGVKLKKESKRVREKFEKAMDNDFNTPKALAALYSFANEVNKYANKNDKINKKVKKSTINVFKDLGSIIGILQEGKSVEESKLNELVNLVVKIREKLRANGNYRLSDKIRERLKKIGVKVEDTEKGIKWFITPK